MSPAFLDHFVNTFIIRDPRYALPSLYNMMPDFTVEEAGYEQQYRLFQMVAARTSRTPVVIDAEELCRQPEQVVRAYCATVGIPFLPHALTWQPGRPAEFQPWPEWHTNVIHSRGFHPTCSSTSDPPRTEATIAAAYAYCLPFYQQMYAHRLRVHADPEAQAAAQPIYSQSHSQT